MSTERGMSIFLDIFRRADKNDDGKISWEEFIAFFADGVMGKEELQSLFMDIDTHKTNNIDTGELCDYFSKHLGEFQELYGILEDLNKKINGILASTSQSYPQKSRIDKFITRFLMSEVVNQTSALQKPLESAANSLDELARKESNITPVHISDIMIKPDVAIVPGRVVRRAKRQISGLAQSASEASFVNMRLETQVDRLATLLDRMENRVNFDGVVDEEVDTDADNTLLLLQVDMDVKTDKKEDFKNATRDYIEAANSSPGCLSISVRSYIDSNKFTMYQVWTSEEEQRSYMGSDASCKYEESHQENLASPTQTRSIWWQLK
ncbi:hypothetical protein ACJMK2_009719 [Sinanodonta woodiana]|uniref:Uncharacterized protein n=1 Tax=Sinanodonta woodiana TaxID=1069815 RepID=A0ABD3VEP8_SINWO